MNPRVLCVLFCVSFLLPCLVESGHHHQGDDQGLAVLLAAGILAKLLRHHHEEHHVHIPVPVEHHDHHHGSGSERYYVQQHPGNFYNLHGGMMASPSMMAQRYVYPAAPSSIPF